MRCNNCDKEMDQVSTEVASGGHADWYAHTYECKKCGANVTETGVC